MLCAMAGKFLNSFFTMPFLGSITHHIASEDNGWNLILVNRDNYIPADYKVQLTELSNGKKVDSRIYPELQEMFDDARAQGYYRYVGKEVASEIYSQGICLEEYIDTDKYQILLKPHQVVYKELVKSGMFSNSLIPAFIDTNELLSITDILISDYSSIFFDFLVTDRPIMFYIPDLEEYKDTRGLYMEPEKLPGPATDSLDKLSEMLANPYEAVKDWADNYRNAKEQFCPDDDGHVSERIVNAIFKNEYNHVKVVRPLQNKKKIFISLGRALQNGITHSFLSLLNNLNYDRFDVTAYLYEPIAEDQILRIKEYL